MPAWTSGGCIAIALTSLLSVVSPAAACPAAGEIAVVCEVNHARGARSRPALAPQPALTLAAGRHARDMVRRRYFAHVSPSGRTLVDRMRSAGYLRRLARSWALGETLAWGTGERAEPAAIVDAWMRSRSHRRVLLSRAYREIGVAVEPGTPFGPDGSTFVAELGRVGA
jgi:uncharacterized protein YkwD